MKFITTCLTVILSGATLMAQEAPPPEHHRGPRGFQTQELQEHLQLSEDQVAALKANREALREAMKPLMEQIGEKRGQLREEMHSATPNSGAIGQLNVEMKGLMEQMKTLREESRASAVAGLTASQQTALEELQNALKLQRVAQQAVGSNLIAPPEGGFGMGMEGMGPGPRGMRGMRGKGMRGGFGPGPGHGPGPAPDAN